MNSINPDAHRPWRKATLFLFQSSGLKLAVLERRVKKLAKRCFGLPDFHYHALAEDIRVLL